MVHDPKSRATRCDNNYFTAASFVTLANPRASVEMFKKTEFEQFL